MKGGLFMYFEPTKKTYYRFPSVSSVNQMDTRFYFPDKPYSTGENIRLESKDEYSSVNQKSSYDKIQN